MPVCNCCGQELPKTYKIGQIFKHNDVFYILCLVEYDKVGFICLNDGNRWTNPKKINVNNWSITINDFHNKIVEEDSGFIPVNVDIKEKTND